MPKMSKKKKTVVEGYIDEEDVRNWGDVLCNAYCMPAVCIKPRGNSIIKVRITFEEI